MSKITIQEHQIIERIRLGNDTEAIQFLYKNVYPNVRKFVIQRFGNEDDAYDVFQEALLEIYQSIIEHTYPEKFTISGYMYKMCTFKWLNKSKRDQRLDFKEDFMEFELADTSTTENFDFVNTNEEEVLKTYFQNMGEKCVELLTNTILLDYSLDEVRVKMDFASIGAVKMQHKRCKEKMMELIQKYPSIEQKLRARVQHG
jgi:RNA polymerase sigma factor (sigma-70 family)